jgi:hypothetical protein
MRLSFLFALVRLKMLTTNTADRAWDELEPLLLDAHAHGMDIGDVQTLAARAIANADYETVWPAELFQRYCAGETD